MLWPLRWLVWSILRVVMWCRYWVRVIGKAEVRRRPGPYLILPNHPAFCDPPNVIAHLWATFRMRPMLLASNFRNPFLAPFSWLLRGIYVPDVVTTSAETRQQAEAAVQAAIDALKAGDNVIIWPSGRLMRDGLEHLGGARTVADVLAAVPNVTVVLARTRGLWGSMYSYASTGEPQLRLGGLIFRGLLLWLANLLLFAPRRRATITLEAFGPGERPEPTRDQINPWLEAWFDADLAGQPERPTYVPRHFLFGPRTIQFPSRPREGEVDLSRIKAATREAVTHIIEDKLKRPLAPEENTAGTTFAHLGMDSLDLMDVVLHVEQRFGFSSNGLLTNLGQLWALAEGLLDSAPPKPPPPGWFDPPSDLSPLTIEGETIPAAILGRAFRQRRDMIAADDIAGGVTYERLIVGAWVMRSRFIQLDAVNVGLMLPASVACDVAYLGLQLAGKLPVLLNWTTGPAHMAHAVKLMGLTHVVTSRAFVDRLRIEVPDAEFLFLEDVRASVGKLGLLRRLLSVRWFPTVTRTKLLKRVTRDPHAPAVVLFTSGSEKAPKAVPLTHNNVLSNQRACIQALKLSRDNSVMGFLPMFHSFGMTITGLLPLVVGVRVVHHPDPTDAGAIVRKVASYRTTLIAGTPTFMGYILDRAKPGDLDTLRLIVLGAEKPPPSLFEKARQLAPNAEVIEGYGITECTPVIAVTLPGMGQQGTLGPPLPGVSVCVTDLETGAVVPPGTRGMLNVSGPNVFPGYLGYDGPSPFREIDGKQWYVTGDLGEIRPADGIILFHGRLKRFIKAGGEMISLPALEEPFTRLYPPTDRGPRVAVEGIETHDGRRIVLFTTEEIGLREANAVLLAEGFRGVMRIDAVQKLDALPTLGTGKTDYKVLRAMITTE